MGDFELVHGQNILSIYNFFYSPEDEKGGNPYNINFLLKVISGEFSGVGECEYNIKEFRRFAREITNMYEFRILYRTN